MNEVNFVLSLVEAGVKPEEIRALRKHFWLDGRIDMRSAAVQTALATDQDLIPYLVARAKELDAKACAPTPVRVVADQG